MHLPRSDWDGVSCEDTGSAAASQTQKEHLLWDRDEGHSPACGEGRPGSALLTCLSCSLYWTFPRAIKLLGNIALILKERPSVYFRWSIDKVIFKSIIGVLGACCELLYHDSQVPLLRNGAAHFLFDFNTERIWLGLQFQKTGSPLSYFHAIFEKSRKTLHSDEAGSISGRKTRIRDCISNKWSSKRLIKPVKVCKAHPGWGI